MERHEVTWDDDDSVLDFINSKWENKDYYKRGLERQWLEVIAAYEGLPYHRYSDIERRLVRNYKVPRWRVRLAVNLLLPYVRTATAKHLRNRPIFDVIPATSDNKDISVALAGKKTLQSFWFNNDINYQFIDILLWVALTGNAFAYCFWNPDAGEKIELSVQDFISQGDQSQEAITQAAQDFQKFVQQTGQRSIRAGDLDIEVPTPFDILYPYTTQFKKKPWFIRSQTREISHYIDLGFKETDFTKPTAKDNRFIHYAKRVNSFMQLGWGSEEIDTFDQENEILELHLWMPPSKQQGLEDGRFVIAAGGKIISNQPNPYRHGEIPYVQFFAERTPGKTWGFSSAAQVLPVLREYQKGQSQLIEARNLMSKPKWLSPRLANLKKTSLTSEPGEIVEFSGGIAPQAWTPPPIPRYVHSLLVSHQKDMDTIAAQRDATKGENPSGSRSGDMIEALQAADDSQLSVIGLMFDTGFSKVGRFLLSTASQFYREDRLISLTGEKNRFESMLLKSGTLIGDSNALGTNYYNVRVTQFSQFGLTRAGQLKSLEILLRFGVFSGPESRSKVLKFINMGYFEDEIDEFKMDRANAYRENLMMAAGQPWGSPEDPFPVGLEDADETHIEEHTIFMKGDQYKILPPELKSVFQQHLQQSKLYKIMKLIEPQVIALKAQILAARLNGIPPEIILGASDAGRDNASGNNGNASNRNQNRTNATART